LALALVDRARAWGVPFAFVVADAGYGDNPTFLQGLESRQIAYMVGVSSTFGVRLPDEVRTAALGRPARPHRRGQPKKPRPAPLYAAQAVLTALSEDRWQPITWREHDDVVPPQTVRGRARALGHQWCPIRHQPSPGLHGTGRLAAG
jgi:SRSO17 transposase